MKKKRVVNKKNNFIYKNFSLSLDYIKDSRNFIWFVLVLLLVTAVLGYFFYGLFEEQLTRMLENLLKQTEGLGTFDLMTFIITNNAKSSFFGLFFGVFFGIVPLGMISINGFLLGFVANKAINAHGIFVLWKLFPHGIFEIPAVLISVGLGTRLGTFFLFIKQRWKGIGAFFISLMCFILLFSFFSIIISFFAGSTNPSDIQNFMTSFMKDPLFIILYVFLSFIFLFISLFIGLFLFSIKERNVIKKDLISKFVNSVRVFVFVVIPLLVIAGIIEGLLIKLIG